MITPLKPLISVIVPVYNVEKYLDDCLNSIKQQTYSNLEIIVVEDCSTDNSSNVLHPHLKDTRIKLVKHVKNSGLSAARNTGIEAACGEYIMFVDSDDIIDFNFVRANLDAALKVQADVVLSTAMPFQDGESIQSLPEKSMKSNECRIISKDEYFAYPHFAWLKFMRADLMHERRLRFLVDQYYEDWPFHWELGFVAIKVVAICDGYYHYRQRGDSITGGGDLKLLHIFSSQRLMISIVEKYSSPLASRRILASKIYSGLWFVLTSIDSKYINEAIISAKQHIKHTKEQCKYSSPSLKEWVITFCAKQPFFLAKLSINIIRIVLNKLSTARKNNK